MGNLALRQRPRYHAYDPAAARHGRLRRDGHQPHAAAAVDQAVTARGDGAAQVTRGILVEPVDARFRTRKYTNGFHD